MGDYVVKYTLKKDTEKLFLYSKSNIVAEVSNKFLNFTGYSEKELIGKSLREISCMLRIDSQVYLENIENEYSCYMFTKEYEPKEVTIVCKNLQYENEKICFIKENATTCIKEKFDFVELFSTDRKTGVAINSVPDLILLKSNQNYLDTLDEPYNKMENSIGRKKKEISTGYEGSKYEELWNTVISTGKPYYFEEREYNHYKSGDKYWNSSIVPIFVEGKLKYIIQTALDVTEKVLNRKVINQKNEELNAIIENMSDGLFSVDKDYKYTGLNTNVKEFIYKHDSMKNIGDTFSHTKYYDAQGNLLKIEDHPAYRVLRGERLKEGSITAHRPDGIYHFNLSGSPVYDKNRNVEKALFCTRDVTEQVNKENLIRQQRRQLDTVIENISDELIILDTNGKYIKANKTATENYLYNDTEIKSSKSIYEEAEHFDIDGNLVPYENFPSNRVIRGEKFSGYRLVSRNNKGTAYREISGTPIYDSAGDFIAGVLICHDIADMIKNEENLLLKTQYDLLNMMIENLDLAFVRFSYPEFIIIDINNKAYYELKQINPKIESLSSVKGNLIYDVFIIEEKDKFNKNIEKSVENKVPSCFNIRKVLVTGEEKYFKIVGQPLFGLNNQIVELIGIAIDITEEVKAKNQMEKNLKIQEEIFANISHELKTPLNVIFSTAQLFELYLKSDSITANINKISRGVNIIKQNCYRLTKLISNIVDISKIDSGYFELNLSNENIVNITEDIVQSVSEYIKGKGLSITFDTNTEEKIIACDADKIERIILNLISNAIKFSNPGGSIFVNILNKGHIVEIEVRDTGIGIDQKYLDNIFERFHQVDKSLSRNAEGSGIGLSLVKSIVELLDGKISAESIVGEGSTFKIELPARTVEIPTYIDKNKPINSNVERINIEFSDIYLI
jgi:signal transduction histidine kinase